MFDINAFYTGYKYAALWSSTDTDADGEAYPLEAKFSDVSPACHAAMLRDCYRFAAENAANLETLREVSEGCDEWRMGFLFWLSRHRHGTGFWDETPGYSIGDKLSDACKPWGDFYLFGDIDAGVVRSHHYG